MKEAATVIQQFLSKVPGRRIHSQTATGGIKGWVTFQHVAIAQDGTSDLTLETQPPHKTHSSTRYSLRYLITTSRNMKKNSENKV